MAEFAEFITAIGSLLGGLLLWLQIQDLRSKAEQAETQDARRRRVAAHFALSRTSRAVSELIRLYSKLLHDDLNPVVTQFSGFDDQDLFKVSELGTCHDGLSSLHVQKTISNLQIASARFDRDIQNQRKDQRPIYYVDRRNYIETLAILVVCRCHIGILLGYARGHAESPRFSESALGGYEALLLFDGLTLYGPGHGVASYEGDRVLIQANVEEQLSQYLAYIPWWARDGKWT